jgi:hypothetical protein
MITLLIREEHSSTNSLLLLNIGGWRRPARDRDIWRQTIEDQGPLQAVMPLKKKTQNKNCPGMLPSLQTCYVFPWFTFPHAFPQLINKRNVGKLIFLLFSTMCCTVHMAGTHNVLQSAHGRHPQCAAQCTWQAPTMCCTVHMVGTLRILSF